MWDDEILSSQEENVIVKEIVQIIMMLDYSKKPFKQSDITSQLSQKLGRNNFSKILEQAKNALNSLGLELVETKDTSAKSFFLISKQKPLQSMHKYDTGEEVPNRILLTLVLSYILLKNGTVVSEDLLNHMRKLKIYNEEGVPHPYFGDVKKKVLHDFIDQLYLCSTCIPDTELCEITWGQRADLEITKASIYSFISQCGFNKKLEMEVLISHFREIAQKKTDNNLAKEVDLVGLKINECVRHLDLDDLENHELDELDDLEDLENLENLEKYDLDHIENIEKDDSHDLENLNEDDSDDSENSDKDDLNNFEKSEKQNLHDLKSSEKDDSDDSEDSEDS